MFLQIISFAVCAAAALPLVQKFLPLLLGAAAARVPQVFPVVALYAKLDAHTQIGICAAVSLLTSPLLVNIGTIISFLIWPTLFLALLIVGLLTVGGPAQAAALTLVRICPFLTRLADKYVCIVLPELEASLTPAVENADRKEEEIVFRSRQPVNAK